MSTPVPPWLGYVEFVANPASGGGPPPTFRLLQEGGGGFILQEDAVSHILEG